MKGKTASVTMFALLLDILWSLHRLLETSLKKANNPAFHDIFMLVRLHLLLLVHAELFVKV